VKTVQCTTVSESPRPLPIQQVTHMRGAYHQVLCFVRRVVNNTLFTEAVSGWLHSCERARPQVCHVAHLAEC
jgi:hypothetical protein